MVERRIRLKYIFLIPIAISIIIGYSVFDWNESMYEQSHNPNNSIEWKEHYEKLHVVGQIESLMIIILGGIFSFIITRIKKRVELEC